MAHSHSKLCPCGSGLSRYDLRDAAGIFCTFVCDECEDVKRAKFDPAIFEQGSTYAITGDEQDIVPTIIAADGYADGGAPYTEDELAIIRNEPALRAVAEGRFDY